MKIVVINGLPITGKTEVAQRLEKEIENTEVIHLDEYGGEDSLMRSSKKEEIYRRLKESENDVVIIEGLTWDQEFINELVEVSKEIKAEFFYFEFQRDVDKILQVPPKERNTREDLMKIGESLDGLDVPNKQILKEDYYLKPMIVAEKIGVKY